LIAIGLRAAMRLAVGHADGLDLLTPPEGQPLAVARRSFWAMALALPGFLLLRAVDTPPQAYMHGLWRDLLGYVIGWVGFVLISHQLARLGGRMALWPRFVAAWNFCNVLQYMMLMVASLPSVLGWPAWMAQAAWLVAVGWTIWLEYFTTRTAMRLPVGLAIGWVVIDFALGIAVDAAMSSFGG
jgi:hypothetical protein